MSHQYGPYQPPQEQKPYTAPQYGPPQGQPPYGRQQPQQMPGPYGYQQQPMPYPPQMPPPGYQQPMLYATPQAPGRSNYVGAVALTLGITGCVLVLLPITWRFGFILGAPGTVSGIAALARVNYGTANNRGISTAGLILSILAVVLTFVVYIAYKDADLI